MKRLHGYRAIEYAEKNSLTLCKYNDPTEAAREGLSIDEANSVAREDSDLIYIDIEAEGKEVALLIFEAPATCKECTVVQYDEHEEEYLCPLLILSGIYQDCPNNGRHEKCPIVIVDKKHIKEVLTCDQNTRKQG